MGAVATPRWSGSWRSSFLTRDWEYWEPVFKEKEIPINVCSGPRTCSKTRRPTPMTSSVLWNTMHSAQRCCPTSPIRFDSLGRPRSAQEPTDRLRYGPHHASVRLYRRGYRAPRRKRRDLLRRPRATRVGTRAKLWSPLQRSVARDATRSRASPRNGAVKQRDAAIFATATR